MMFSALQLLADAATPPQRGNRVVLRSPMRDRASENSSSAGNTPVGATMGAAASVDVSPASTADRMHNVSYRYADSPSPNSKQPSQQRHHQYHHQYHRADDGVDDESPQPNLYPNSKDFYVMRDDRNSSNSNNAGASVSPQPMMSHQGEGASHRSPSFEHQQQHEQQQQQQQHRGGSSVSPRMAEESASMPRPSPGAASATSSSARARNTGETDHEEFLSQVLHELQALNERNRELVEAKAALTVRAERAEAAARSAHEEAERVRVHHRVLSQTSVELQDELRAALEKLDAQKREHERSIAAHALELSELSGRLAREEAFAAGANAELHAQRAHSGDAVAEAAASEAQLRREVDELQARILEMAAERDGAESRQVRECTERAERAERRVAEQRAFVQDLQRRVEAAEAKATLATAERKSDAHKSEAHAHTAARISELEAALHTQQEEHRKRMKRQVRLEGELEHAKGALAAATAELEKQGARQAMLAPQIEQMALLACECRGALIPSSASTSSKMAAAPRKSSASARTDSTRKLPSDLPLSQQTTDASSSAAASDCDFDDGGSSTVRDDAVDEVSVDVGNGSAFCCGASSTAAPDSRYDDDESASPQPHAPHHQHHHQHSSGMLPPTYPLQQPQQQQPQRRSTSQQSSRRRSTSPSATSTARSKSHSHSTSNAIEHTPVSLLQGANPLFQVQFAAAILRRVQSARASACGRDAAACVRARKENGELRARLDAALATAHARSTEAAAAALERERAQAQVFQRTASDRESVSTLADELAATAADLAAARREKAAVEEALAALQQKLEQEAFAAAEGRCALQEARERCEKLQAALHKSEAQRHAADDRAKHEREGVANLKSELETLSKKSAEAAEKFDKHKELLNNSLRREQKRYTRALQHADKLEAKHTNAQCEIAALASRLKVAENDAADKARTVARLEREKKDGAAQLTKHAGAERRLAAEDAALHVLAESLADALVEHDRGAVALAELVYEKSDFRCVPWDLLEELPATGRHTFASAASGDVVDTLAGMHRFADVARTRAEGASHMLLSLGEFALEGAARGKQLSEALDLERERVEFLTSELAVYLNSARRQRAAENATAERGDDEAIDMSTGIVNSSVNHGDDDDGDGDDDTDDYCAIIGVRQSETPLQHHERTPPVTRSTKSKSSSSRRRHHHRRSNDASSPPSELFVS